MIGDIAAKALIVVKADTSQAKAAIKDLSATEQKAAKERVEAQEKANAAYERSTQKFALYAAGGVAAFSILSSSLKKYEEHLKKLGPSGEAELKRINDATGSLTKSQDSLQISLGRVAAAAVPVIAQMASMADALAGVADAVGRIAAEALSLPGVKQVAGNAWRLLPQGQLLTAASYLRSQLGGGGVNEAAVKEQLAALDAEIEARRLAIEDLGPLGGGQSGMGSGGNASGSNPFWQGLGAAQKRKEDAKKRRSGPTAGDPYGAAWRSVSGDIAATSGSYRGGGDLGYGRDLTDAELLGLAGDAAGNDNLGRMGGDPLEAYRQRMDASIEAAKQMAGAQQQRESMLERIFGPVSEFELYTTAWQGLEAVVTAGLGAWIDGSQSAGEAMKTALHGFAKQLAGEAALQALRHTAFGIGSLAIGGPLAGATAGGHFKAAAAWGGVALAAGIIGGNTRPSTGSNANAAAGIGGGRYGGSGTQQTSLTVVMGDSFAGDSPRYVARKTRRSMENARRYADYEGAVPG